MTDVSVAKRAIPLLDLTTLSGDEDESFIVDLCAKAQTPAGPVAGVCVYREWVPVLKRELDGSGVRVVTVANFPGGACDVELTRDETAAGVAAGADEVDIVFPWEAWLAGRQSEAVAVVEAARAACPVTLKVIIESGRLGGEVAAVSKAVIEAGTDFVKTSTGKLEPAATPEAARAMLETIAALKPTVGFKASGGIRTTDQAAEYLAIADEILGSGWASAKTFRIGASSLLDDLLGVLGHTSASASGNSNY